jgi:monoamine oxidase
MDIPSNPVIIIIGAGAAGLMAAHELSAAGIATVVLEAADAAGGRIRTIQPRASDNKPVSSPGGGIGMLHENSRGGRQNLFSRPVEAGAEFVHGDLPLTLHLLKEAGIPFQRVAGEMISVKNGKWDGQGFMNEEWGQLIQRMKELKKDLPLAEFLSAWFGEEKYAALRNSAERYAGGFDLADPRTASTLALYKEWDAEDGHQYRIEGGYDRLIAYLAAQCCEKGCALHLSSPVKEIEWERGRVKVSTAGGNVFTGDKVIITVSAGVLQLSAGAPGASSPGPGMASAGSSAAATRSPSAGASAAAIRFSPAIPDYLRAAGKLGYGTVTKILMEFREPFWEKWNQRGGRSEQNERGGGNKKIGFIISDEVIPTWWTQLPDEYPMLTGWVPGAVSKEFGGIGPEELTDRSLSSLARIFSIGRAELEEQLVAVQITDWSAEPFVLGGYSFDTMESAGARQLLREPVQDTLYFTGEALHEGIAPATVEAALASGQETAKKIAAQS